MSAEQIKLAAEGKILNQLRQQMRHRVWERMEEWARKWEEKWKRRKAQIMAERTKRIEHVMCPQLVPAARCSVSEFTFSISPFSISGSQDLALVRPSPPGSPGSPFHSAFSHSFPTFPARDTSPPPKSPAKSPVERITPKTAPPAPRKATRRETDPGSCSPPRTPKQPVFGIGFPAMSWETLSFLQSSSHFGTASGGFGIGDPLGLSGGSTLLLRPERKRPRPGTAAVI
eukprot:Hpha_TRINITY_DN3399_c0_g1::TRINITY_DN3399_c0_g1_i1::g.172432::m.172432